jgi:hypothetical protein
MTANETDLATGRGAPSRGVGRGRERCAHRQPFPAGDAGRIAGLNDFGASAAYAVLYERFGLTADAVVAAARESLAAAGAPPAAPTGPDSAGVLHTSTGDR